jgi:hypothetical protein
MILRELVTRLGFELDDRNLKKFDRAIESSKVKLAGLGDSLRSVRSSMLAVGAAVSALTLISVSTAKSAIETDKLADKLRITSDELQLLELAAQSSGLEVNELSKSFDTFNVKLSQTGAASAKMTKDLSGLAISTKDQNGNLKSSFTLYEEVASKISTIEDPIRRAGLSLRLLGTTNNELVSLFDDSNQSFQKQREEIEKLGYVINTDGIRTSKQFIKSWNSLKIIIDGVKKELSIKFMPVFSELINNFKLWYGANRKLISQNIGAVIRIISSTLSLLLNVVKLILTPINALIKLFGGLDNVLNVLSYTLGILMIPRILAFANAVRVLTVALLANPVTWLTAAFVGLAAVVGLLIDDFLHWKDGNESLIGDLLGSWVDFKKDFMSILDAIVNGFKITFTPLGEWFSSLFDDILKTISTIADAMSLGIGNIKEKTIFRNVVTKNVTVGDALSAVKDEQRILRKIELIDESDLNDPISPRLNPLVDPNSSISGMSSLTTNSSSNKVNQYITENVTVNVPIGTSAEQGRIISDQVTEIFKEQFNYNILRGMDSLSSR